MSSYLYEHHTQRTPVNLSTYYGNRIECSCDRCMLHCAQYETIILLVRENSRAILTFSQGLVGKHDCSFPEIRMKQCSKLGAKFEVNRMQSIVRNLNRSCTTVVGFPSSAAKLSLVKLVFRKVITTTVAQTAHSAMNAVATATLTRLRSNLLILVVPWLAVSQNLQVW